jgi:hypothetical protein
VCALRTLFSELGRGEQALRCSETFSETFPACRLMACPEIRRLMEGLSSNFYALRHAKDGKPAVWPAAAAAAAASRDHVFL